MSQATRILLALVAGLVLGIVSIATRGAWVEDVIGIAEPIGRLWLNALQMTIVPLVVSLLISGIAAAGEAARASRLAGRAIMLFILLLWTSSALAAVRWMRPRMERRSAAIRLKAPAICASSSRVATRTSAPVRSPPAMRDRSSIIHSVTGMNSSAASSRSSSASR